jgi:hypothetical protein
MANRSIGSPDRVERWVMCLGPISWLWRWINVAARGIFFMVPPRKFWNDSQLSYALIIPD